MSESTDEILPEGLLENLRRNSPSLPLNALRREAVKWERKRARLLEKFPETLEVLSSGSIDPSDPRGLVRFCDETLEILNVQIALRGRINSQVKQLRRNPAKEGAPSMTNEAEPGAPNPTTDEGGVGTEPWYEKLRAARNNAKLTRAKAVMLLRNRNVRITTEAIKKHEEGKAMPRPPVRKGYAEIYQTSEDLLFPNVGE